KVSDSKYSVLSSSKTKTYNVVWNEDRWTCDCEDYRRTRKKCKHIYAVIYYQIVSKLVNSVDDIGEPQCPYCGNTTSIIRRGLRYCKKGVIQRFYCKNCNKRFINEPDEKHDPRIIVKGLDLYFRGLSLRQTAEHISMTEHVKISYSSVLRWLRKYSEIAQQFSDRATVNSERWSADETVVRLNGRKILIWNLLDERTRYLIATRISKERTAEDAIKLFEDARMKTEGTQEVITDAAPCYEDAVGKVLRQDVVHIAGPGLACGINNNKIERFNKTLKQRIGLMSSFRSKATAEAFIKGFQFYYNYIKPHRSLHGKTPGQASGLTEGKLDWRTLLSHAKGEQAEKV
ncbi:MAG: IS6 family transposase, partial [Conexivisphaerales archaeon]